MLHYHKPNINIATIYGEIKVDEEGKVSGLTKAQEKEFKNIVGYTYTEDKKKEPKKEEDKKEETSTEPKKKTTRRTTRKTTTKKEEE